MVACPHGLITASGSCGSWSWLSQAMQYPSAARARFLRTGSALLRRRSTGERRMEATQPDETFSWLLAQCYLRGSCTYLFLSMISLCAQAHAKRWYAKPPTTKIPRGLGKPRPSQLLNYVYLLGRALGGTLGTYDSLQQAREAGDFAPVAPALPDSDS